MLDGLTDDEMNSFMEEHPTIVPVFEIDVLPAVEPYVANTIEHEAPYEPDLASIKDLQYARDALDHELAISQCVKASTLEDINLGSLAKTCIVKIVFAWSCNDMKSLDPQYYQHRIHLNTNVRRIQQGRYWMKPNYAARVNEEIDKLLRVRFIRPIKRATWLSPIMVVPKKNG